jgi:hypothetical protein
MKDMILEVGTLSMTYLSRLYHTQRLYQIRVHTLHVIVILYEGIQEIVISCSVSPILLQED